MNPSREYLQACSIQTGYQVAPLEKVVRLGEMAGDITRHPFLGRVLDRDYKQMEGIFSDVILKTLRRRKA